MTDAEGWFHDINPADQPAAVAAIREGEATTPQRWPEQAVEAGIAETSADYYERLRTATIAAAEATITEHEQADDRQLIHAVRAMDDCEQQANAVAERVTEWGATLVDIDDTGMDYLQTVAEYEPQTEPERQLTTLAQRGVDLHAQATQLRRYIEQQAPTVAPNLAALAGPILATRLMSLAGSLEELAKLPSSTVQVLGAEDALFAHLRGEGSSPKHGVIFTHEYVRGTPPAHRGSAARALAGKLTIAARIDHYAGDCRPELEQELDDRIRTIRARGGEQ